MLGLEPRGSRLLSDPVLPEEISWIELKNVRGPWGTALAMAGEPPEQPVRDAISLAVRRPKELSLPREAGGCLLPPRAGLRLGPALRTPGTSSAGLPRIRAAGGRRSGRTSVRFDVAGAGSWRIVVDEGITSVEEGDGDAAAVFEVPESLLLEIARGEQNGLTAYLRGQIVIHGDRAVADEARRYLSELHITS